MFITLKKLEKIGACVVARDEFIKIFGWKARVSIEKIVERLNEDKRVDWKMWLIVQGIVNDKNRRLAKEIIKYDNKLNLKRDDGEIPLMFVMRCFKDKKKIIKFLINNGIDINAQNSDGATALMATINFRFLNFAKSLIKAGANVNISDDDGETALMYAVANENEEIVELLITSGVDVNIRNINGNTALDLANEYDNDNNIIKLLKSYGAV